MTIRAKVSADTPVTALATYAGHFAAAAMSVAAARWLPVQQRGALALMAVVGTFSQVIGGGGLPIAIAYSYAQRSIPLQALHRFNRAAAIRRGFVASLMSATCGLTLVPFTDLPWPTVLLFTPWVFFTVLVSFALFGAVGEGRFRAAALHRVSITVLPSILAALAALVAHRVSIVAFAYSAGTACGAIVAWRDLSRRSMSGNIARPGQTDGASVSQEQALTIYRYGRGALLGTLTQQLNGRLDLLLVGLIVSTTAAGVYAVALSVGQLVMPAFIACSVVAFQRVATVSGRRDKRRSAGRFWVMSAVFAIAVIAVGVPLVGWAITTLFGQSYESGESAARVLFVGVCLAGVTLVTNELLRGLGASHRSSIGDGLGVLAMILLLISFPPKQIIDMAWISTIAYCVGLATSAVLLAQSTRHPSPGTNSDG